MTDDEFLTMISLRTGRSREQTLQRYVILPCACGVKSCPGWLSILRSDSSMIRSHLRDTHPKPAPSITRDDYLAREQRRLKGRTFTWPPLSTGEKP
jgi:hypothetical protein